MVITHPHSDHIGGLIDIVDAFEISQVLVSPIKYESGQYSQLLRQIYGKKVKAHIPSIKESHHLKDCSIEVFCPNIEFSNINNNCIVIRIVYGETSLLFVGDAEQEEENWLLIKGFDISSNVLKIGHHCGSTSTSPSFLKAVNPQIAVISVGEQNIYGHPDNSTLFRIHQLAKEVYRTDKNGTIIIQSNGENFKVDKMPVTFQRTERVASGYEFIGNFKSKTFHYATCSFVPFKENQIGFHSCNEALKSGYKRCKKCNPQD